MYINDVVSTSDVRQKCEFDVRSTPSLPLAIYTKTSETILDVCQIETLGQRQTYVGDVNLTFCPHQVYVFNMFNKRRRNSEVRIINNY